MFRREIDDTSREPTNGDDQYLSCRKLLSAVFLDAVKDYRIDLKRFHVPEQLKGLKERKEDATNWIFEEPTDREPIRLTFKCCCDLLDLDLGDVRKRLKEGVT